MEAYDVFSDDEDSMEGGAVKIDKYDSIEKFYPKYSSNLLSRFELCHVITQLAKYIESLTDLSKYMDTEDSKELLTLINPAEQAFKLLMKHKFDPVLKRRNEKVSFSVLEVNPQDIDLIEWDFKQQREEQKKLMDKWKFEYK